MVRGVRGDSGQVSVLVLAISIALLFGTYSIGLGAEVLVMQQRLNSKADAIALAGATELEFNQELACGLAQEFGMTNFGLNVDCGLREGSIEIMVSETNLNQLSSKVIPKIHASSRAGIVSPN